MEQHHFVLVHGGMHGAWAWYKLVDRLQKAGHKVTALDMAGAGTHPANPDSIATYEYNQPVTDFFQSLPEDDHQKMFQDTPNSRAIQNHFGEGPDKPPTSISISKPLMKEILYDDWDSEDIVLATILGRPFPSRMLGLPITYTKEKYGQVPVVYIKYLRDNTFPVPAQHWVAENMGPFKEVIEIDGDHFSYWRKIDEFTQLVFRLEENYFVK